MDTYHLIIVICLIVITSFIFNVLSNKTNIPSVLMLITLGMVVKYFFDLSGFQQAFMPTLELLGVVGLIMIVLEAALDLKLSPERWPIIWKSTLVAFLTLNITTFGFAGMMMFVVQGLEFTVALLYSLPLAIISSAIVIPSVHKMTRTRREFMIYESTLSDIFGIMAFYILLENTNANGFWEIVGNVTMNLSLTVLISFIGSFILLYIFQKLVVIKTKFFLFLSLLILLYAEGKIFHLSSLLIILVFGLVLRNQFLFIRGKLSKYFDHQAIGVLFDSFKMITEETSFLVRSFFFVVFGMAISIGDVLNWQVLLLSFAFLVILYLIRFVIFRSVVGKDIFPEVFIAPRGLISILLFFDIPEEFKVHEIESGILGIAILVTSLVMGWALAQWRNRMRVGTEE